MSSSYCVKCRGNTQTSGARLVTSANGRRMMKGQCVSCGTNKSQFVSASGSAGVLPKRKAKKKGAKSGAGILDFFKSIF